MNTAFKLLLPSLIRLLMGGVSALLLSKGMDASTAGAVTDQLTNIIMAVTIGSGAMAWSLKEKSKPPLAGNLTKVPDDNWEPMPGDVPRETVKFDVPRETRPPKGYHLSERSLGILAHVDKRLQELFETAIINSPHDFTVYHGKRTDAEQEEMVRSGASRVPHSKHQDALAVDFFIIGKDGKPDWRSEDKYREVSDHIKAVAERMDIGIVWGGDWKTLVDMVHIELK